MDGIFHELSRKTDPGKLLGYLNFSDGRPDPKFQKGLADAIAYLDDHGYDGEHIDVVERKAHHGDSANMMIGSVSVQTTTSGNNEEIVIDTNTPTFFGDFTILGLVIALIAATILGAPFAKESDGHLEIALTKPIGRTPLAVQTMLVDCAGVMPQTALRGYCARSSATSPATASISRCRALVQNAIRGDM